MKVLPKREIKKRIYTYNANKQEKLHYKVMRNGALIETKKKNKNKKIINEKKKLNNLYIPIYFNNDLYINIIQYLKKRKINNMKTADVPILNIIMIFFLIRKIFFFCNESIRFL